MAPRPKQEGSPRPPSRQGKKAVGGFFDDAKWKKLKMIGLEHDKTMQELLSEATDDLIAKYERKRKLTG